MARMKAHPKNYTQAEALLDGRDALKLGHNTWLVHRGEYISVRFHNTDVVRFYLDGRVTVHTGGWYTVTTKDRINDFIAPRVYQKNHKWFVTFHDSNGRLDWENPAVFEEGMSVTP